MDCSLSAGINLTIDDKTTETGFSNNTKSGSSLWHDKKVSTDSSVYGGGTNSFVTVAGEVVKDTKSNAPKGTLTYIYTRSNGFRGEG